MAVGISTVGTDSELRYYNGRITWLVLLSCVIAASGGLLFGYDTGVSGGVATMEPFLQRFFPEIYRRMKEETETSNYCKFDSQLLTAFTSSIYIAGLCASFFASRVTREYGRKPSIIIGGVSFFIGTVLGSTAYNIYMLIIGRLLLGVGVGFTNQSVPLYLAEMAPPKHRGAFNYGFQVCVGGGGLIAFLINYGTSMIDGDIGWRISLGMAAVPALILVIGAIFLPETPNSLVQQGYDNEKVKTILQRIRGTDDVQTELDDLIIASKASKAITHPSKKILQRKYVPQLVMAVAIPFFQQVTGITVISFYAPILFRTIGFGESASLMSAVITGVVGTGMTVVSSSIVDKLGRRAIFLVGGFQMFITQMMIGVLMAMKLGDHGGLSQSDSILMLTLICIYVAGFGFSWGPLGWVITSEISPLEIRSVAQSITVAVSFFFSFLVGQVFLTMLCHLKSATFLFFGVWVVLMTGFVYFLLPETKNIPIESMENIWKEHGFWTRFVSNGEEYSDSGKIEEPLLQENI